MRTRAAVALQAGQPLEVMDVDLDGPKPGEVMVEIRATGICHTDEFTRSGADPEGIFPSILGHEGAGVVVEVGPGVTRSAQMARAVSIGVIGSRGTGTRVQADMGGAVRCVNARPRRAARAAAALCHGRRCLRTGSPLRRNAIAPCGPDLRCCAHRAYAWPRHDGSRTCAG